MGTSVWGFMPHGHCYLWTPSLVLLEVLANALIGLAYASIAATLAHIVSKIRDLPFERMYLPSARSSCRAGSRTSSTC